MSLLRLREDVKVCMLCRLASSRINAVPGEGKVDSKIMFVGEAPGKSEDEQGRPFVGLAGRVLEQALKNAGISREDVYITNVVKCRPPNNRRPLRDEINTCIRYLEREIELINPLIICILGSTAYRTLLNGKSIMNDRGKLIRYKDRYYYLTLHPAAAIYNPSLKVTLFNDIINLLNILIKLESRTN